MRRHVMSLAGCSTVLCLFGAGLAQAWDALPTRCTGTADNPTTAAKVELGKMLYHDPRFSETGTVSWRPATTSWKAATTTGRPRSACTA